MTKFKSSSVAESIANAIRGLKLALRTQRNFVIEIFIAFIVVLTAILFRFDLIEISILIVMCALVLICELINSVIEFTLDAVYRNNYSKLVETAKDLSAGMVLLCAGFSVIIGVIIYGSHIAEYFIGL